MIYQKNEFNEEELAQRFWEISNEAYPGGSPWTKEQFLVDIQQPHTHYMLLVEDETIYGFLGYAKVIDEVEITNIAVSKAMQGKGHARALLQSLLNQEKGKQTLQIFLEVRVSNQRARGLYESLNFQIIGQRKTYYQNPIEDAIIMSKKLKTETIK